MSILGWRVFFTRRGLPRPRTEDVGYTDPDALAEWLDEHGVLDGQPFLISPAGGYDVDLNRVFATVLSASPWNTQAAVARDLSGEPAAAGGAGLHGPPRARRRPHS
ncbi:hypothetical protein ACFVJM_31020 [Streptomyces virginiae]|uniref:hypothetical protein n=1 Tax=Streptomyces virginiae TaxID=1961 RepID=UPI0036337822